MKTLDDATLPLASGHRWVEDAPVRRATTRAKPWQPLTGADDAAQRTANYKRRAKDARARGSDAVALRHATWQAAYRDAAAALRAGAPLPRVNSGLREFAEHLEAA
jgi:hypothetical protein